MPRLPMPRLSIPRLLMAAALTLTAICQQPATHAIASQQEPPQQDPPPQERESPAEPPTDTPPCHGGLLTPAAHRCSCAKAKMCRGNSDSIPSAEDEKNGITKCFNACTKSKCMCHEPCDSMNTHRSPLDIPAELQ